ncbi:hypothetical protein Cni_G09321 [Canna indica]|uniref:Uncharacterized protein n=1 Tax=Canna indica TaxID=4628 RepID=A0AAQ3K2A3_9LILI|nr:hypothetical protein Cni_G09321 [Canna indica]
MKRSVTLSARHAHQLRRARRRHALDRRPHGLPRLLRRPTESGVSSIKAQVREKELFGMLGLLEADFTPLFSFSASSSSSSDKEFSPAAAAAEALRSKRRPVVHIIRGQKKTSSTESRIQALSQLSKQKSN